MSEENEAISGMQPNLDVPQFKPGGDHAQSETPNQHVSPLNHDEATVTMQPIPGLPHPDSDLDHLFLDTQPPDVQARDQGETKSWLAPRGQLSPLVAEIRETHRIREDYLKEIKSVTLRICAIIRRITGCSKGEAPKILKVLFDGSIHEVKPNEAVSLAEGEEDHGRVVTQLKDVLLSLCAPFQECRQLLSHHCKLYEKRLIQLAKQLPVWPWTETLRGLGALGLAQIIGETGDLSGYATPAKVWKRMGVGLVNGERQRKHVDQELALLHGYNPKRRSVLWNVGCSLIKQNDGKYRQLYDECKAKQTELHPDLTKLHLHRRAQRRMEKQLLKDLWVEWNRGHRNDANQTNLAAVHHPPEGENH
jgi:hypothetical protein